MGTHLKDTIEGTCRKAMNDEEGNNIPDTYQKKLGIGEFIGNIDAIKENSICTFWANKCSGHFPPSNFEGLYILKTEHTVDGEGRQFSVQTAYPLGGAGEGRVSVRMIYGEADSADPTGSTGTWIEIPSEFTIKDFDIDFTSKDDENPASWTSMGKIASGKLKDLFGSVSLMAKNLRYLWKLCGTTNIASIGGGTLTGAVSKLNTDLQGMDGIKYIDFGAYDGSKKTLDDVVKEILNNFPLALNNTYIGYFVMGPTYRIIIQPFRERTHASAIVFSYATKGVVFYTKIVNNVKKYTASWDETAI